MESNIEGGRERRAVGIHDLQHQVTLRLDESQPVHLHFQWEGGLEVYTTPRSLPPGSPSGGPRILDFVREGEDWILTVEGDGGGRAEVFLRGEPVEALEDDVHLRQEGENVVALVLDFPNVSARQVRTIHLRRPG